MFWSYPLECQILSPLFSKHILDPSYCLLITSTSCPKYHSWHWDYNDEKDRQGSCPYHFLIQLRQTVWFVSVCPVSSFHFKTVTNWYFSALQKGWLHSLNSYFTRAPQNQALAIVFQYLPLFFPIRVMPNIMPLFKHMINSALLPLHVTYFLPEMPFPSHPG